MSAAPATANLFAKSATLRALDMATRHLPEQDMAVDLLGVNFEPQTMLTRRSLPGADLELEGEWVPATDWKAARNACMAFLQMGGAGIKDTRRGACRPQAGLEPAFP